MFTNIPEVKLGVIAVSRSCFPAALSERRRAALKDAYGEGLYECPVTVENEVQAKEAVKDVKANGVNALVVFLGNFGPETPETLIAQWFHGPIMYVAAAEGDGDLHDGRGDAYCGMLNCSYNLGLRGKNNGHPCGLRGGYLRRTERVHRYLCLRRYLHPAGHQQHRPCFSLRKGYPGQV